VREPQILKPRNAGLFFGRFCRQNGTFQVSLAPVSAFPDRAIPGPNGTRSMNPNKVSREKLNTLTDLPNIGPSIAGDLQLIGINAPAQLTGQDPIKLYRQLCKQTNIVHDPCILDVFISIVRFMDGEAPQPWWHYTAERKRMLK
jgi:hypothetical protein